MLAVRNLKKYLTNFKCHNRLLMSTNLTRSLLLRHNAVSSVQINNSSQLSSSNKFLTTNNQLKNNQYLHTGQLFLQENGKLCLVFGFDIFQMC